MNRLDFWRQKLIQLLPERVRAFAPPELGARSLPPGTQAPDRLANGADRPLLGGIDIDERLASLATHPLQPGADLKLPPARPRAPSSAASSLPWQDEDALQRLALRVWREQREWKAEGPPGSLIPADNSCPDRPFFSHTRMAAAACFVAELDAENRPEAREPCMVRISLHGVQDFIAESRKTRDLWTACMIYGELVWAAMEPIVEHYGPDTILYPDLLGNPLMDQWLLRRGGEEANAVPAHIREAGAPTSSVPVPNTFAALLPRGGEDAGHLVPVRKLIDRCETSVRERWESMTSASESKLAEELGEGSWRQLYRRQLAKPPDLSWTAVAWPRRMFGQGTPPDDLPALPGRRPEAPTGQLPGVLRERARELQPWTPPRVWRAYEHLRTVAWRVSAGGGGDPLGEERGFDYPLVHWQLHRVHETTALTRQPSRTSEPGEKCTLTGRHEALSNSPAGDQRDLHRQRKAAKDLWKGREKDASGAIRPLGGPAAFKRYLAKAPERGGLVERWNGVGKQAPDKSDITAPFPSTAGLAAGPFLERVAEGWPELQQEVRAVIEALDQSSLDQETQHPRSLPRLRPWIDGTDRILRRLLTMEAQYLSLSVLQTHLDRAEQAQKEPIERLMRSVERLCKRASELRLPLPGEEIALLAMDGDGISKLVLGDPKVIRARWRDVLHPAVVTRIERAREGPLATSGWLGLLDEPRAMGPSLHATITRALADFTDVLVPWVIEVEFSGRLVYAGGDDLLAMLPANEIVPAAARIQQLYSAPWVVDVAPNTPPWAGRKGLPEEALRKGIRFRVPVARDGGIDPFDWRFEKTLVHEGEVETPPLSSRTDPFEGVRVFPMLGRSHSLSGGAALGHFKTPLQALILAARENLELRAKERTRAGTQGHLSVSRFTGGASKSTFTAPWSLGVGFGSTKSPPALAQTFQSLVEAFRGHRIEGDGRIPKKEQRRSPTLSSRLPYALREVTAILAPVLKDLWESSNSHSFESFIEKESPNSRSFRAIIEDMVAKEVPGEQAKRVAALLLAGFEPRETSSIEQAQSMVSGLLLARHLAGEGASGG